MKISILTSLYEPDEYFLSQAIASVEQQELAGGIDLEWVVQEDGPRRSHQDLFAHLGFVSYQANGAHLGVAATRNIALSRASAPLVQVLDQDDVLLPTAISTLQYHFQDDSIHWAVGQADDLMLDGSRKSWVPQIDTGRVSAGTVNNLAIEREGNWPIHCAGLMMRTQIVRAIGGWVAGVGDDDVAMFAAVSEIADGFNDPNVTWLYRLHEGQLHRRAETVVKSQQARTDALARVAAVRATGLNISSQRIEEPIRRTAGAAEKPD